MIPFKHVYITIATDFELEPVIQQYLETYPDSRPRQYPIVWSAKNERVEGDYAYIIVYQRDHKANNRVGLLEFIQSYCQVNDKVMAVDGREKGFPDIGTPTYGDGQKYKKKPSTT